MRAAAVNKAIFLTAIAALFVSPQFAVADSSYQVNADTGGNTAVVPSAGIVTRTGQRSNVVIRIINSCFPTNLRGVSNPLAERGYVKADIGITIGQSPITIKAIYPTQVATAVGSTAKSLRNVDQKDPLFSNVKFGNDPVGYSFIALNSGGAEIKGMTMGIYGNVVQLSIPSMAKATIDLTGAIKKENVGKAFLTKYSFQQKVEQCTTAPNPAHPSIFSGSCGQYMGKDGTLSASVGGINVASDNTAIELSVAFPGQTGFCGGYWSPLMLFFADERPKFDGKSEFMLDGRGSTYWPEAGAPGYFLALDREGDGKISQSNQLFGDAHGSSNGFEALKPHDTNKDGKISAADADFKKLRLWQDKNGDGVSQPDEVSTLASHGIVSISLKYEDVLRVLGPTAEEKGRSEFVYRGKKGKMVKGRIVDIWLKPAESRGTASKQETKP